MLAGREPVGTADALARRQANKPVEPKDELDDLLDELDNFDL